MKGSRTTVEYSTNVSYHLMLVPHVTHLSIPGFCGRNSYNSAPSSARSEPIEGRQANVDRSIPVFKVETSLTVMNAKGTSKLSTVSLKGTVAMKLKLIGYWVTTAAIALETRAGWGDGPDS